MFPWDTNLNTTMGLLYLQSGHLGRAFERLGNALALDSEKVQALGRRVAEQQAQGGVYKAMTGFSGLESRPNEK